MARRYDDPYERDLRDRRPRDPRDMQRELDSRERFEPREQRRLDSREPDRMDYSRDSRSDLRTTRDPPSHSAYPYPSQMERDDVPSRSYADDARGRHRPPIDLQSQRREEASLFQEYFLPGEDINREVIQYDIARYLGNDATVRPYQHKDGRQGYLIKAYRALTSVMITTLKQDSKRFEQEQAQRRRQYGQSGPYGQSATFDDRQRQSRPDVSQSGYAGYQMDTRMDTRMDDYDDDYRGAARGYRDREPRMSSRMDTSIDDVGGDDYRGAIRGYRDREPRTSSRMDTSIDDGDGDDYRGAVQGYRDREPRMDSRMDPRQDTRPLLPSNPHRQISPPPYGLSINQSSLAPRTSGPETSGPPFLRPRTPEPEISGIGAWASVKPGRTLLTRRQVSYQGGYPITTTETPGPALAYEDPAAGKSTTIYGRSGHPGWGDTPNFREDGPRA